MQPGFGIQTCRNSMAAASASSHTVVARNITRIEESMRVGHVIVDSYLALDQEIRIYIVLHLPIISAILTQFNFEQPSSEPRVWRLAIGLSKTLTSNPGTLNVEYVMNNSI